MAGTVCLSDPLQMPVSLDTIANLAKQRGFVYQSSEIHGGTRSATTAARSGWSCHRMTTEHPTSRRLDTITHISGDIERV